MSVIPFPLLVTTKLSTDIVTYVLETKLVWIGNTDLAEIKDVLSLGHKIYVLRYALSYT